MLLVMVTSLVFRFADNDLDKEVLSFSRDWKADRQFYSTALETLLIGTLIPVAVVMTCPSQAERAQRTIATMATKNPISLEQLAVTSDARDRIRRAVDAVRVQGSVSQVFTDLIAEAEIEDEPPTVAGMFERIGAARRSAPDGQIKVGEFIAFWRASEPPDRYVPEQGRPKPVASYSRTKHLRNILAESSLAAGDTVGIDEFTGVIELLMEDEFQQVNNPAVGRVYFLNKRTRKSRWKLPTVDEWLLELHTATPPQLVTGPSHQSNAAARVPKRAPPPLFPNAQTVTTETTANPLAQRPTVAMPTAQQQQARRHLPRRQTQRAQEGLAGGDGYWERRYSHEHSRYFYVNKRTGEKSWSAPSDDL